MRALYAVTAWLWWCSVAVAGAFALVWIAIYVLIVPRIAEMRPLVENRLSLALGIPLRIGGMSAQVNGLMPVFELTQVRLLDAQGGDALVLKKITAALSPQSILDFGFEQLLVEQPELAVRRDAGGRITVAGLDVEQSTTAVTDNRLATDWLFSQAEVVVRGGTVRWVDELRGAPPLTLADVNLYFRNQGRRHQIRVDASPPAVWGERFSLSADMRGPLLTTRSGDWRQWQGQVFADFPRVDVQELKQYTNLGVEVATGRGALRGWLALDRASVREATTDLALADVDVRLRADLPPLAMSALSGRLVVSNTASDFSVRTEQLSFVMRDGMSWPGGNIYFKIDQRDVPEKTNGEFNADKLDMAALAQISDHLPMDAAVHRWLTALKPQGIVPRLQAKWVGPLEAPIKYEVQGLAQRISLQASASASTPSQGVSTTGVVWHPGVRNANLDFKFNEKSGQARLTLEQGSITLPGAFEQPNVALDKLSTDIQWQATGELWRVELNQLQFANADAQGEARVRWQTADPLKSKNKSRFPGVLDLQGTLLRAEGTQVHRYLPLIVAKEARQYVREAIVQGKASKGSFKIKGDLQDLPFTDPAQGEFRIAAQIDGVILDYVPRALLPKGALPWPALTQINGELVFDRRSMLVKGATARIANAPSLQLSKVEALIPDLTQKQIVNIQADIKGSAAEMVSVVNTSALLELSGKALTQASVNGTADLRLRLQLPVIELERSRVQGTLTLAANDIQFSPSSPALRLARGQVLFSEKGFALKEASARALGGDVRIEGGSRLNPGPNDVTIALRAQGIATAEGMRQAKELGYVSRLAAQASGSAAYVASLNFRSGIPEIAISSSLQGLALNLPQPLTKSADAVLALRYENSLVRDSMQEGRRLQDQLSLDLSGLATVSYLRDVSGVTPRVIRGRIGVGLAAGESIAANDEAGVAANINFAQLNLDAWERLLAGSGNAAPNSGEAIKPASTVLSPETQGYLPSIMAVRARELTWQGRTLNNVVVGGSRDDLIWRANLDARELSGYVEYRQSSANNPGRVYARLSRLALASTAVSDIEATLDQQPTAIPSLDIVVEDLELKGKKLGRVEVEALNRDAAGVREWRLTRLNLSLPEAQFNATGNWALLGASQMGLRNPRAERRRTALNFRLDITDSGELLRRFGQDKVIARGKGRMEGQVAWVGAPWALDYASMTGGFNINVESGQFLKADPGIAKLLGVLSLQSLPRRLSLDFRDVFSEGFAFDFMRGDVKIDQGVASTNNLQMKGVNAAVLMEGSANIERETQDIKVVVVPEINAGTASLVATVINPAVGIGTFLAQMILRRPVIQAATQEFHVTGSWLEPQIVRTKRSAPIPVSGSGAATELGVTKP